MKKIILIALTGCLVFFCVCCSSEAPEIVPEFIVDYEPDLHGITVRHGSRWVQELCPSVGFSSAGDKIHARMNELEKKYGCKYTFEEWEDGSSRLLAQYAAGVDSIDVIDSHANSAGYALYRTGCLMALDDIPGIDVSDDKWAPETFRQYGYFDGKYYGFYQYAWEFMPEYAGIMLFNGEILNDAGLPYPYEYQETDSWTWANFRKMLEECRDQEKDIPNFRPCVSVDYLYDAEGFIFSNGGQFVKQDGTGKYVVDIENEKVYQAIDFLAKLNADGLYTSEGMDAFTRDRAAFVGCESYFATHHYESEAYPITVMPNFGFMPCPYGPQGDPNAPTSFIHAHRRMNWIINLTDIDPADMGVILDFMYEPLDDEEGWRSFAESMIFHHYQGFKNYEFLLDNVNYNYSVQANVFINSEVFQDAILGRITSTEAIATLAQQAQALLDQNMNDPSLKNR